MTNWPSSTGGDVLQSHIKIMDNKDKKIADEVLLKVSKEIAIKFIEVGRLTPATFETNFPKIYDTVKKTVKKT